MNRTLLALAAALVSLALPGRSSARPNAPTAVGRWDLTMHGARGDYPSWLEVTESGGQLEGRFVGRTGSVGPVRQVTFPGTTLLFTMGRAQGRQSRYEATLTGDRLEGKTTGPGGNEMKWEGKRAPGLKREHAPEWDEAMALFNGKDLAGWHARNAGQQNGWTARDGELVNATPGNDIVTDRTFTDLKIHAEFKYPAGSNSGIYLRGRYEFQIDDDFGKPAESHGTGGIYGFLAPRVNAARPSGEWQSCDITLVGRLVSATLNGEKILDNQEIPGITGGALDSNEGAPGPIMLQGDHGPIEFRNVMLTPARRG